MPRKEKRHFRRFTTSRRSFNGELLQLLEHTPTVKGIQVGSYLLRQRDLTPKRLAEQLGHEERTRFVHGGFANSSSHDDSVTSNPYDDANRDSDWAFDHRTQHGSDDSTAQSDKGSVKWLQGCYLCHTHDYSCIDSEPNGITTRSSQICNPHPRSSSSRLSATNLSSSATEGSWSRKDEQSDAVTDVSKRERTSSNSADNDKAKRLPSLSASTLRHRCCTPSLSSASSNEANETDAVKARATRRTARGKSPVVLGGTCNKQTQTSKCKTLITVSFRAKLAGSIEMSGGRQRQKALASASTRCMSEFDENCTSESSEDEVSVHQRRDDRSDGESNDSDAKEVMREVRQSSVEDMSEKLAYQSSLFSGFCKQKPADCLRSPLSHPSVCCREESAGQLDTNMSGAHQRPNKHRDQCIDEACNDAKNSGKGALQGFDSTHLAVWHRFSDQKEFATVWDSTKESAAENVHGGLDVDWDSTYSTAADKLDNSEDQHASLIWSDESMVLDITQQPCEKACQRCILRTVSNIVSTCSTMACSNTDESLKRTASEAHVSVSVTMLPRSGAMVEQWMACHTYQTPSRPLARVTLQRVDSGSNASFCHSCQKALFIGETRKVYGAFIDRKDHITRELIFCASCAPQCALCGDVYQPWLLCDDKLWCPACMWIKAD